MDNKDGRCGGNVTSELEPFILLVGLEISLSLQSKYFIISNTCAVYDAPGGVGLKHIFVIIDAERNGRHDEPTNLAGYQNQIHTVIGF